MPTVTGGSGSTTYSMDCGSAGFPTGLRIAGSSLTGSPVSEYDEFCLWKATASGPPEIEAQFLFRLLVDPADATITQFERASSVIRNFEAERPILPFELPRVRLGTGGFTNLVTYTVEPALPAGLSLDPSDGIPASANARVSITGTPTDAAGVPLTRYQLKATPQDGTTFSAPDPFSFQMRITGGNVVRWTLGDAAQRRVLWSAVSWPPSSGSDLQTITYTGPGWTTGTVQDLPVPRVPDSWGGDGQDHGYILIPALRQAADRNACGAPGTDPGVIRFWPGGIPQGKQQCAKVVLDLLGRQGQ